MAMIRNIAVISGSPHFQRSVPMMKTTREAAARPSASHCAPDIAACEAAAFSETARCSCVIVAPMFRARQRRA